MEVILHGWVDLEEVSTTTACIEVPDGTGVGDTSRTWLHPKDVGSVFKGTTDDVGLVGDADFGLAGGQCHIGTRVASAKGVGRLAIGGRVDHHLVGRNTVGSQV